MCQQHIGVAHHSHACRRVRPAQLAVELGPEAGITVAAVTEETECHRPLQMRT